MPTSISLFHIKWFIPALLTITIVILSCKHDPVIPMDPEISFTRDVLPTIRNNCTTSGCHDGYSELKPLVYYQDVVGYVSSGNAQQSDLYKRITMLGGGRMPPNGQLTERQITLIYTWIMQGAKND